MSEELVKRLTEKRAAAWEQAKSLLDVATLENRDLSAEESAQFDRINQDIDAYDARAKQILDVEARERAITESRNALGLPQDFTPAEIKQAMGLTEGMVRLSCGIEDVEDLMADLDHALAGL